MLSLSNLNIFIDDVLQSANATYTRATLETDEETSRCYLQHSEIHKYLTQLILHSRYFFLYKISIQIYKINPVKQNANSSSEQTKKVIKLPLNFIKESTEKSLSKME